MAAGISPLVRLARLRVEKERLSEASVNIFARGPKEVRFKQREQQSFWQKIP